MTCAHGSASYRVFALPAPPSLPLPSPRQPPLLLSPEFSLFWNVTELEPYGVWPLRQAFFNQDFAPKVPPWLFVAWSVFLPLDHAPLSGWATTGHLGRFQVLATVEKAVMNFGSGSPCRRVSFSSGSVPRGRMARFARKPPLSSHVAGCSASPPAVVRVPAARVLASLWCRWGPRGVSGGDVQLLTDRRRRAPVHTLGCRRRVASGGVCLVFSRAVCSRVEFQEVF